ncbi:hypothetical protein [Salipaludibacillus sp. CF4.18]|uniref:hypothetical protein n=1 Tax=Salipaludibacillus sp. CF4.18 TaxID=3373081 RepID=UPI003EE4F465
MKISIIGSQYLFLEGIRGLLKSDGLDSSIHLFDEKNVNDLIMDEPDLVIFEMDEKTAEKWLRDTMGLTVILMME